MQFITEYSNLLLSLKAACNALTLDTVLLPARPEHLHISSTLAREMLRHHQSLDRYIPAGAMGALNRIRQGKV